MKVDFAVFSRARERHDPDQLLRLRIARKGPTRRPSSWEREGV